MYCEMIKGKNHIIKKDRNFISLCYFPPKTSPNNNNNNNKITVVLK